MKNGRFVKGGVECWYKDGLLHRDDGPAVIYASGDTEWYMGGRWHRQDGPAYIEADGWEEWYVDGEQIAADHLRSIGLCDFPANGFTDEQVSMLRIIL